MMGNARVILWAAALAVVWLPPDLTVHRVILVAAGTALFVVGAMAFVWLMDLPWKRRTPWRR